jgi:Arc/MetJ-type ribon-helix-helix transcriptional regulator
MSKQIEVRIPNALAKALDDLVSEGMFETKAQAIRAAHQRSSIRNDAGGGGAHRGRVPADPAGRGRG